MPSISSATPPAPSAAARRTASSAAITSVVGCSYTSLSFIRGAEAGRARVASNLDRAVRFYTEVLGMKVIRRKDYPDVIYKTVEAKMRAIVTEIVREHVRGRPLLVGTTSVEASEHLSNRLNRETAGDRVVYG